MAAKDVLKVSRKTFINPKAWFGYDQFKNSVTTTWGIIRNLFIVAKPDRIETFEEAMRRQNTTEADLVELSKTYQFYTWLFVLIGGLTVLSSFYFLIYHYTFAGFLLGLACASLFFVQAFRYSFWHFQIKFRKLGCTLAEWWRGKPFNQEDNA